MPTLDRSAIDPEADRVVRKLTRAGYKAYLVGGCVRDLLVGQVPKDFDVATSATPNEIKATFRNSRIIGRRFRLVHVVFGAKIIETATFRANPRDDDDHDLLIRRDNVFGTEAEDARRRDFTINGLFYDVEREEVLDHVGGLADLEARLIRTIGDPDIRFQEDPVRMLRAIKFAARLNFGVEAATWNAMLRWRAEISKCAPPRLLEEVHRLLRGGAARRSFELLVETNALAVLSPHLAGLLEGTGAPTVSAPVFDTHPRSTIARVAYDDEDPAEHDPDDPDDPDMLDDPDMPDDPDVPEDRWQSRMMLEGSGRLAPGMGDDAVPSRAIGGEGEQGDRDLDDEERDWHRVWAEDSPAQPVLARSLELSFLSHADLTMRRSLAWRALQKLDLAVAGGTIPSTAVAFATLTAPFLHFAEGREPKGGVVMAALEQILAPLISELRVTRRDAERLRYLLAAHHRLVSARRRNMPSELAGGRELVEEASLLHTLIERAAGNDAVLPIAIAASGGGGAASETEDDDGDRPRKRRRRRRGGRRRRADTAE